MFNNLIESRSHANEFKRRGSFLLFTTATYVALLLITGVVSIYAYDAHLEAQSTELEILSWVPEPPPEETREVPEDTIRPSSDSHSATTRPTRTAAIDSTSNPLNIPPDVGTKASPVPPWRPDAVISDTNTDPPVPPSSGRGVPDGRAAAPVVDIPDNPPPPPPPTPKPVKVVKSPTVLNSRALSLPIPHYPPIARITGTQGVVTVQVLIDETGKVVSAKAVSGPVVLIPEAQRAALQARFSPTMIGDQPVKVSGVITYRFVLN